MTSPKNGVRRLLNSSVASVCKDCGFDSASKASLETLTELLQAHLTQLTDSCRKFCELGHRTTPDLTDVVMALAEIGCSAHALNLYCKKIPSQSAKQLSAAKPIVDHKSLKSGLPKINQPSYIPAHFIEYPEVHSYVRTPSLREPVNQYDVVRERVAKQNVLTEESLVKFLAHTKPSDIGLFENVDKDFYPTIRIDSDPYPYLRGLLPNQKEMQIGDLSLNEYKSDVNTEEDIQDMIGSQNSLGSSNNSNIDNPYIREPKRIRTKK